MKLTLVVADDDVDEVISSIDLGFAAPVTKLCLCAV